MDKPDSKKNEVQDEETKKERLAKEALLKFNFFIHLTAYVAGCSYLGIMEIIFPAAFPYILIPIFLWTGGIAYHFYWAFKLKGTRKKKKKVAGNGCSSQPKEL
ncbi:MAG: hypothetical protein PHO53_01880 [Actinomycetota bacterium]|nr:hypothetical protein [Actinomycetota bacterium]